MSQLSELFKAVSEQGLSKQQLEDFHSQLSSLFGAMHLEAAELEKAEAIFFAESEEKTDIATKRKWAVTEKGQRQIQIKHSIKATEKIISSTKTRMYNIY